MGTGGRVVPSMVVYKCGRALSVTSLTNPIGFKPFKPGHTHTTCIENRITLQRVPNLLGSKTLIYTIHSMSNKMKIVDKTKDADKKTSVKATYHIYRYVYMFYSSRAGAPFEADCLGQWRTCR